jgi:DNA-binding NtrC family response regulator
MKSSGHNSAIRVLHVEDSPSYAFWVREALSVWEEAHVEITHVDSVEAALQQLSEEQFDLIILDLDLPDSRGVATVSRVLDAGIGIPVVVLSGHTEREEAREALARGARDYLFKNCACPQCLRGAIERALGLSAGWECPLQVAVSN